MPPTPARRARDLEAVEADREAGRRATEEKYTEFKLGCDEGLPESCTALGEWWAMMRGDYHAAARLYTPACLKHRNGQACLNLGRTLGE
jgi:TPR repeat protein